MANFFEEDRWQRKQPLCKMTSGNI